MFLGTVFLVLSLSSFLPAIAALQEAWAQCGGPGSTSGTTCVSGYVCTVLNTEYSQCLPRTVTRNSLSNANYWFSFGDSYTQTGFVVNGTLPAPGNPLGNPPYPGSTAVGGTNWIDVDTTVYNHSLVLTYNYAYGGATIDASLVAPSAPNILTLTDQVNEFLDTVANKPPSTPWTSSNALFSIWIGINDIGNSYSESGDHSAFSDTLLNAEFALVQKLSLDSLAGARNFLWINVPPVDRTPLMLSNPASAQAAEKTVITDFNSKLAARVSLFREIYPGVQTWLYDANSAFTAILDSPSAYGFVDATSYTGTNDFWNGNYHPSSAVHDILGKQIGSLLGNTVW